MGRNCSDISFDNIAHFYNSYCLKSLVKFLFHPALTDGKQSGLGFVLIIYFSLLPSGREQKSSCANVSWTKERKKISKDFRLLRKVFVFAFLWDSGSHGLKKRNKHREPGTFKCGNTMVFFMLHFHCYVDVQILLSHSIHFLILKRFLIGR